jgi:hypothetical protein
MVNGEHFASGRGHLYAEITAGGENEEEHGEVACYVEKVYLHDIRPFSAEKLEKVFEIIVFDNVALFYALAVAPIEQRKQIALRLIVFFAQVKFPPGKIKFLRLTRRDRRSSLRRDSSYSPKAVPLYRDR